MPVLAEGQRKKTPGWWVLAAVLILLPMVPAALFGWSFVQPVVIQLGGHGLAFGRVTPQGEKHLANVRGPMITFEYFDNSGKPAPDYYLLSYW